MTKLEAHEIALRYPWSEETVESMVEDIKGHGQREEIVLLDGKILDGRHRAEACRRLNRQPRTREFGSRESDGTSPTRFAHSMNVERRHVDKSVLAMLAAESVGEEDRAAAKARMVEGQKSGGRGNKKNSPDDRQESSSGDSSRPRDREAVSDAATAFGVSTRQVYRAQALIREAPEVAERVKAGELTVHAAEREAGIAAPNKPEPKPDSPKPNPRRKAPDANGAPLHERTILDPELRARVVELLSDGLTITETAAVIEHGDAAYGSGAVGGFKKPSNTTVSKVSRIRLESADKADPLESLVDAIEAAQSDFKSWCASFEPKWRTATPAQADRLRARVDAMVSSARRFVSQLNKEIQS